ncbi:SDR family oxidoreductase [Caldilinea sp.]|jgi:NAD(P)-dependent dehydrogenase (short-subunit alcohol dehydrogenase family)|uniref:SDR family oxidoreductase n=1 Tax=Caldilinea sp. TaxID=2293560 RepID=UPI001B04A67D|nr:SDR family oxidoreductase [Caldilinea sp.]MBO9394468.1 SDR family oxidoreductase [Caldilinea sp.]
MVERAWTLKDKAVLITGATNGIGKVTAHRLAAQGAHVTIVSRNAEKCRAVADEIRSQTGAVVDWIAADLSVLAGIEEAAAEYRARNDRLHVLINNAGAFFAERLVTADGYEMTFALNHLNYFLLTLRLRDLLLASAPARIINVSSDAHYGGVIDFDDIMGERKYSGWRAYSQSKLANVMFTYSLARQLDGTGVTANALHPGFVATGFGRNNSGWVGLFMPIVHLFALKPEKGAETSVYLASSPAVSGVSGKYFANCREKPSSKRSYDVAAQEKLWALSEQLTLKTVPAPSSAP